MRSAVALVALAAGAGAAGSATATPGPDSVAVLANANLEGSVALALRYAEARAVPLDRVCLLPVPEGPDVPLAVYLEAIEGPFRACLDAAGATADIEAVVLARGVPLRVVLPPEVGGGRVSLAAALGLWNTRRLETDAPVLGLPPGRLVPCGPEAMCLGAAWRNGYSGGRFSPGWSLDSVGIRHAPLLVTALFGRTDADAARLVEQSLASDGAGPGAGVVMLMAGADPARGALDGEYDFVALALEARGLPVARVPFEADLAGERLAGFVTGTASLGRTIEGNVFEPGALVDNLTSFGAVAENFDPGGAEAQVSVARWVAAGATGVHGTTDEPLNNCFPSRRFLVDAADGATLAEAFHSNLPFAYWHNLVLGDPMAAPHAVRPVVEVRVPVDTEGPFEAVATDPANRGAPDLRLLVDGERVAEGTGELSVCAEPDVSTHTWLVVAQAADDDSPGAYWRPKGWRAVELPLRPMPGGCTVPDAGLVPDAGAVPDAAEVVDAAPVPDAAEAPDVGPVSDGAAGDTDAAVVVDLGQGPADAQRTPGMADAVGGVTEETDAVAAGGAVRRGGGSGGCELALVPSGDGRWAGALLLALSVGRARRVRRRPRGA